MGREQGDAVASAARGRPRSPGSGRTGSAAPSSPRAIMRRAGARSRARGARCATLGPWPTFRCVSFPTRGTGPAAAHPGSRAAGRGNPYTSMAPDVRAHGVAVRATLLQSVRLRAGRRRAPARARSPGRGRLRHALQLAARLLPVQLAVPAGRASGSRASRTGSSSSTTGRSAKRCGSCSRASASGCGAARAACASSRSSRSAT